MRQRTRRSACARTCPWPACRTALRKYRALRAACQFSSARLAAARKKTTGSRACARDIRELTRTGMALMSERDQVALLHLIVAKGMDLTESDSGCLMLVEADERNVPRLRITLVRDRFTA